LFRVVAPLTVQANGQSCNLTSDDYITRLGDMDKNTGLVNVKVRASRTSDCPKGANTTVALNDLMVMESDQQERIQEGFQMASSNMGKNGLPSGPKPGATAVPLGQTTPDAGLSNTLRDQQTDADQNLKQATTLDGAGGN
jgi:hypothetical protein